MDDVGMGKFFSALFFGTIFLTFLIFSLSLLFVKAKNSLVAFASVLANISAAFFFKLHEIMGIVDLIVFILWPIANFVFLMKALVSHLAKKPEKQKPFLKSKQNPVRQSVIILVLFVFVVFINIVVWKIFRALFILTGLSNRIHIPFNY